MNSHLPAAAATSTGVAPRSVPTTEVATEARRLRRARSGRRCVIIVLSMVVLAGLLGLLGDRTSIASVADDRTALEVTWPGMSRGGLSAPLQLVIVRRGGFDAPVVVEVGRELLGMFDEHGLDPEPAGATSHGESVRWTFDPPEGDTLTVELDGRIEPGRFGRIDSWVVLVLDMGPGLRVSTRTWLVP